MDSQVRFIPNAPSSRRRRWTTRHGLAAILAATIAFSTGGCEDETTTPEPGLQTRIVSGVEMGFIGSGREVRVAATLAERDVWPGHGAPPTTEVLQVHRATWNALVAAIDEASLDALPDVIGCPGCTDGPKEWLEVQRGAFHKRVGFSPWDDLGTGNAALLQLVRALRGD